MANQGQSNIAYYSIYASETASICLYEACKQVEASNLYKQEVKQAVKAAIKHSKSFSDNAEKCTIDLKDQVEQFYENMDKVLYTKRNLIRLAIKQVLDDYNTPYSNELSYLFLADFACKQSTDVIKITTKMMKVANTSFKVGKGGFKLDIPIFKDSVLEESFVFQTHCEKIISLISKKINVEDIDLNTGAVKQLTSVYIKQMFDIDYMNKILP